jgi:hypothetical protein
VKASLKAGMCHWHGSCNAVPALIIKFENTRSSRAADGHSASQMAKLSWQLVATHK